MLFNVISSQKDFDQLCDDMIKFIPSFICIDTEFVRQNTYWPDLCLIQISTPFIDAIIDPLPEKINLEPLKKVLKEKTITKVMHSARQDIEIFWNILQTLPDPIFDTQIAALFLGYSHEISYERLINNFLNITLDKSMQYTNWKLRPLSNAQKQYALADVIYLKETYPLLCKKLIENKRYEWAKEACTLLNKAETYDIDPYKTWLRIKPPTRDTAILSVLKDICAWREIKARQFNINRGRLLENRLLIDLCKLSFLNFEEFEAVINLYSHNLHSLKLFKEFYNFFSALQEDRQNDSALFKKKRMNILEDLNYFHPTRLSGTVEKRLSFLRQLLDELTLSLQLPTHFIISKNDMTDFAKCPTEDHKIFKGWSGDLLKEKIFLSPLFSKEKIIFENLKNTVI